ncbi:metal-dependent hydrolase [Sporomusa sp. KB1]|jgi:hypothetical protein|uniref:metal-dependent hydrolase n=1 Tax=Sporomusa sp. KB1 TaxID=943346 RepID=UPI00119CA97C|nr:metal-dependent hydrolase [Sporomusa sp. KB1]TWH47693.1 LexA-binding, inner membrane-associated putative hydrolase [Sporomusa sp. KB1]
MLPLSHVGFTTAAVKVLETGLRLRQIDYRIVIVSSLLPDIIDKSLFKLLESSYTYESRAIGHSLVFLGFIGILAAIQWFWNKKTWLAPVFIGALFHDVFDVMWIHPGIFYWPLEGWQFSKPIDEAWLGTIQLGWYKIKQRDLFDNISVLILLYFFMKVALGGKILEFVRKGKL